MKKGKWTIIITIGIMSFLLVLVMFMQFKVVEETDIAGIETMRETELREALADWKEKYEETSKKLEDNREKIAEYEAKISENKEASELIEEELEEANMVLGKTDVEGDGVIITLTDNDEKTYTYVNLLDLINELKLAGAEAISINDVRVTTYTYIANISNRYIILNNNTRISSPYVIKAMGDQTNMQSNLNIKGGYIYVLSKNGYTISMEAKKNIKIGKYTGEFDLKYIER